MVSRMPFRTEPRDLVVGTVTAGARERSSEKSKNVWMTETMHHIQLPVEILCRRLHGGREEDLDCTFIAIP
jgi:hypothetical protein